MDETFCQPVAVGDFDDILNVTLKVGTDGLGGQGQQSTTRIVVAAAVVDDGVIGKSAAIYARAHGLQTVPRAEAVGSTPATATH